MYMWSTSVSSSTQKPLGTNVNIRDIYDYLKVLCFVVVFESDNKF
jgi:hypothetical protein